MDDSSVMARLVEHTRPPRVCLQQPPHARHLHGSPLLACQKQEPTTIQGEEVNA